MTIVGCDLHTRKQQVAVLHTDTGSRGAGASPAIRPMVKNGLQAIALNRRLALGSKLWSQRGAPN
jgi:hypothetical protein